MPDALKATLSTDLYTGTVNCGECYSITFDMNAVPASARATNSCVGNGGVGKVWQGTFDLGCKTCASDGSGCEVSGNVELVCCKVASSPDMSQLTIYLFEFGDFATPIATSGPIDTCNWSNICGHTFADKVSGTSWSSDCGTGCNGLINESLTIYDPSDPIGAANCNGGVPPENAGPCPDNAPYTTTLGAGSPLRMPMVAVALDAKTGKPLSFIVEESSSE
jgi:hypothetical protein